jgi:hypothetical protein
VCKKSLNKIFDDILSEKGKKHNKVRK